MILTSPLKYAIAGFYCIGNKMRAMESIIIYQCLIHCILSSTLSVCAARGTRRSFVFVVYKSPAGAIAATASGLKKQTIGEDVVDVRRAVPKDQHQSGHVCTS